MQSVQQLGYGLGDRGTWVLTPAKVRDFLSSSKHPDRRWSTSSFPFNGCQGAHCSGVKLPGCEAENSASPDVEAKNEWSFTGISHTPQCSVL